MGMILIVKNVGTIITETMPKRKSPDSWKSEPRGLPSNGINIENLEGNMTEKR